MTWKKTSTWERWRSDSSRRNDATLRHHTPAALNTHSFGLPVIATDVGSLRNDTMEAKTRFLCRAKNPADLTRTIRTYFASDLYQNLEARHSQIREFASGRDWWTKRGKRFWMRSVDGCSQNKWPEQKKLLAVTIDSDTNKGG